MSTRRRNNTLDQRELQRFVNQLQQMVHAAYSATLNTPTVKRVIDGGSANVGFFFNQNKTADQIVNAELSKLASGMDDAMKRQILSAWQSGAGNSWDEVNRRLPGASQAEMNEVAANIHRQKAAEFYGRNRDGRNVSDRVWNLCKNAKKEIEVIIQNGIKEGKSANEVQRSLQRYLNNPDSLFRRVKDKETGEWEWSKAAKRYKPGKGVSRSAFANAMRLARTEIAGAYRNAELESYRDNPLVTGIEIRIARVRTRLERRKDIDPTDICDCLAGVYPKTFKWTGWHPNCMCYIVPIMITQAEFDKRQQMRANGTLSKWKPKNVVRQMPKQFNDWTATNKNRIELANRRGTLPYWLVDNPRAAGISVNPINTPAQANIRREALREFRAYSSEQWKRKHFDEFSGGYVVIDKRRLEYSERSKGTKATFDKELSQSKVLARNGFRVEMIHEPRGEKSPDIRLNGILAELKRTGVPGKIVKDSKEAVRSVEQRGKGADIVVFEIEQMTPRIRSELNNVKRLEIHVKYFTSDDPTVITL